MRNKVTVLIILLVVSAAATALFRLSPGSHGKYVPTPVEGVVMTCFQESEPLPWAYCINEVPGSDNPDVVYDFHARNGDATWWNDADYHTGKLYEEWRMAGHSAPTVVSISFGKVWVLKDDGADAHGGRTMSS